MKTLKQLLRQPLKSLIGLVFMTLAATIACLCVCQALAAVSTKKGLDERFSTVAIASLQEDLTGTEMFCVDEELMAWLQKTARENPDIIKGLAPNGLLSAYIPQLSPYNFQSQDNVRDYRWDASLYTSGNNTYAGTTHYDSAMLVITLEEISEPVTPMDAHGLLEKIPEGWLKTGDEWVEYLWNLRYQAYRNQGDYQIYQEMIDLALDNTWAEGYTVELTGTIDQTLSVPDGMRDPTGMTARLSLTLPSLEAIEALGLVPGQQYIVYGMDYFDDYQFVVEFLQRSRVSKYKHITFDPFDPAQLTLPTEQQKRDFIKNMRIDPVVLYNFVPLEQWQYDRFNTVSMTLCLPSSLIPYEEVLNEAGEVVDYIPRAVYTYTDGSGKTQTIPMEELNARYAVPMIAPMGGSAEDFLASVEGKPWQEALEQSQVNHHAFAVLGVDDMHQLPAFVLGKSQIGEGREFTAEEVENGAKVCLVHEWVANNAGLQLGDTITLSFYSTDYAAPYQPVSVQELMLQDAHEAIGESYVPTPAWEKGLLRPSASLYFATTPFVETAEYTIVGFWQGSVWPDADKEYFNFSANTVFVPHASVQSAMEQSDSIAFVSVVLENGMIRSFHDLVKRGGYAGRFKYNDQGYGEIAVNFHNYESLAQQIIIVGVVLYVILLLLFLLLYPATQRKTVWTMQSLGCNFGKCFRHVLLSSMIIMTTASVLGGVAGWQLWDQVVAALQATAESSVALQLEPGVLVMVAAAQLLLGLVLSIFVAIFVSVPRGISARR